MADQFEGNFLDVPVYFTFVDGRYSAYNTKFKLLLYPRSWNNRDIDLFTHRVRETWGDGFKKPWRSKEWEEIKKYPEDAEYIFQPPYPFRWSAYGQIFLKPSALYEPTLLLQSSQLLDQVRSEYSWKRDWGLWKEQALEKISA